MTTAPPIANPRSTWRHPRCWARRCAVQALYQWQLTGQPAEVIVAHFLADEERRKADGDYFQELLQQVIARVEDVDAVLRPLLDRPLEQVDMVEQAILRLGAYELLYKTDLPHAIILDEAVELGKHFGAANSYQYINAALDKLAEAVRSDRSAPLPVPDTVDQEAQRCEGRDQ